MPGSLSPAARTAAVLLLTFGVWMYGAHYYSLNKEAIRDQFNDTIDSILLPFRIAELSAKPRDTKLLIPVEGVLLRDIGDTWGAARGEGRIHEGVDVFADRGTPVYSATEGYVVRVGYGARGGNFAFVMGAGGVRYYYAHLNEPALVKVGEKVSTRTVIGLVGNSGNAVDTPPHLHFGMYIRGPQNPYSLLVDRL
jgi:peptidoglycan LD-endopeptidase LytH